MSSENFTRFMNELNRQLFSLVNSAEVTEKLGGILAIDALIDVDVEENATKITRFANYLRIVVASPDVPVMVLAARALGRLARAGGTLTADFVDFEVKRALEWLQSDRSDSRRHAAVLVLTELAKNAPTLFYVHVASFFDLVWVAIRDSKIVVREQGVEALRASLELVGKREIRLRIQWYQKVFEETQKGFRSSNSDIIHGSLLSVGLLVRNTGDFMKPSYKFKEICDTVMRYREKSDKVVRKTVVMLLPRLAQYSPDGFTHDYLNPAMLFLMGQLKKDADRPVVFIAVGEMAMAVKQNVLPYLEQIIVLVKEGLSVKSRKHFVPEALVCISMLAKAIGTEMAKYVPELLEQMFSAGLSKELTTALTEVSNHVPRMRAALQQRLLDVLSIVLAGEPFRVPGTPANARRESFATGPAVSDVRSEDRVLALQTLGSFDFSGYMLLEFVREHVVSFLQGEKAIRQEAALCCAKLLVSDGRAAPVRGHSALLVSEVVGKLLVVGISDPDPVIRHNVLSSLDWRFDHHLAQAENLRSLFIALNDEEFDIREIGIQLIGRLTARNPAVVMPCLRKTLIQLLTELEFSNDSRNKEEAAVLLAHLISSSRRLVKPYVEAIFKALLPKLQDTTSGVSAKVMLALGELSQVGGSDMLQYVDQLMPRIIETLQDQGSVSKREVALRTLGQLCQSTGYVIEPYVQYPDLLMILLGLLKTETSWHIRLELIRTQGILGALDPYKYKLMHWRTDEVVSTTESRDGEGQGGPLSETIDLLGSSTANEEYYPTVAITALMNILRDPSLSTHHTMVIQAVMFIFRSLGMKCVPFLPQIMPPFLHVMNTCEPGFRDFLFQQLGTLVAIVRGHVRPYLREILSLVHRYWNTSLLPQIITLIEEVSIALGDEFKQYLPELIPQMLQVLHSASDSETANTASAAVKMLHALVVFGASLDDYIHLVVPAVVKVFDTSDTPPTVRLAAVNSLGKMCKKLNFSDYASRLVHPLVRQLRLDSNPDLQHEIMETICFLMYQLGSEFDIFVHLVNQVLAEQKIQYPRYEALLSKLLKQLPMQPIPEGDPKSESITSDPSLGEMGSGVRKLHTNQQNLKKAWEASSASTKEDWVEWIRRFSVELLRESPSPALRSCQALAQVYYPLARDLFNAAFVSCWTELYDQFQDELVRSLEMALLSPHIPPEILQQLLNLAEFMEHDDKSLPIDIKKLGLLAEKCHAFAKALHYKEIEFQTSPSSCVEALISINNQLQQPEAAVGILTYAQLNHAMELKESWYEKLGRWEDALSAYERKQSEDPRNREVMLGRLRCLNALGEWEKLSVLGQEVWKSAAELQGGQAILAPIVANAAWHLGHWNAMKEYVNVMETQSVDGSFFRAILDVHDERFDAAQHHIDLTRELLDTELTALVGESYNRAYSVVVRVQQLSEVEEMIEFKRSKDDSVRRSFIKNLWMTRLKGCQHNVDVWRQILAVRSLVVSPTEDVAMWLKFSQLCRKGGRLQLSHKTLVNLLGCDPEQAWREAGGPSSGKPLLSFLPQSTMPRVSFAYLKHLWSAGEQDVAFSELRRFVDSIEEDPTLQARCYYKLSQWRESLAGQMDVATLQDVLESYHNATRLDKDLYKAWHAWAQINFDAIQAHKSIDSKEEVVLKHIVNAAEGFIRSIAVGTAGGKNTLRDTLRVLTLWFRHGSLPAVEEAMVNGFRVVPVETWLQVIPQIIARIHMNNPAVRRQIHELLCSVGREHPQALVYSLTVASKSQSVTRSAAATAVMEDMRQHSNTLVEQAYLVSQELIRVAVLWHEMWHEGLEEASRQYFGDRNVEAMFATLEPLHQMMDAGPETLREISFQQSFGRDLQEAREWCQRYQQGQNVGDLNQAWDLYYHVFRRINKQLPQLTTLELQYVSPRLLEARDLELAVPGTYRSGDDVINIRGFIPTLSVITSKQRPRKLTISGSDGMDYMYLLKGHEDLRQDERVMQLFGLVNTLISNDPETSQHDLSIQRYPVVPLAPNSGVLGWVPNCDTLHVLIREYREAKKILLNIEHRLMLQMAPDFDNLTLLQKVEVFEYALDNTTGQDLYKILWLKSRDSETWLDRRTNFTRSLAVMSMVGYILGLGDRHPSNIMLNQTTGKCLHIDFGDCFEVAMNRDKFPEKVPFRLTRMLINAMEVSGIEGNYRSTCESVMRVLRENKDALMAVLEAFVHDPLINWRLLNTASPILDGTAVETEITDDEKPSTPTGAGTGAGAQASEAALDANADMPEQLNARAIEVTGRVHDKLTGKDFHNTRALDVKTQVKKLIEQATAHENLAPCYTGWCPWW